MIRWGFIGCGDVVEHKSGRPFWLEGKSKVVAVMSRNIENSKAFAEKYSIENYYDDADKLLANEKVDAVYIATTPISHMEYAKKAIEAGKAVYVEKPMGINVLECEEVLELANRKKIPLFVAYYRRALPYFDKIKNILDSGEIGEIRSVIVTQFMPKPDTNEIVWRRDPKIAGGGLFHDLGCHTLDILDYLIAPIKDVYGFSDNQRALFESDDTVSISYKFENGVTGTGLWCFDVNERVENVQIIGNLGRVEFQVYGNKLSITKDGKSEQIEVAPPKFIQEPLIHNVIECLLGNEKALSTGETAIRTTKIIEKVTK